MLHSRILSQFRRLVRNFLWACSDGSHETCARVAFHGHSPTDQIIIDYELQSRALLGKLLIRVMFPGDKSWKPFPSSLYASAWGRLAASLQMDFLRCLPYIATISLLFSPVNHVLMSGCRYHGSTAWHETWGCYSHLRDWGCHSKCMVWCSPWTRCGWWLVGVLWWPTFGPLWWFDIYSSLDFRLVFDHESTSFISISWSHCHVFCA